MNIQNITSQDQSIELAKKIGNAIKPGAIIALKGELGTGKTFITKHIISHLLGEDTHVTSPTFQLLQIYKASGYDIYHYDLYRLKNTNDIFELSIEDAMDGRNICIIEWPEIMESILPSDTIVIELGFEHDNVSGNRYARCSRVNI
jgi:tRNA threonylcarbamoyladenosine biosynthesis protein TsaE